MAIHQPSKQDIERELRLLLSGQSKHLLPTPPSPPPSATSHRHQLSATGLPLPDLLRVTLTSLILVLLLLILASQQQMLGLAAIRRTISQQLHLSVP